MHNYCVKQKEILLAKCFDLSLLFLERKITNMSPQFALPVPRTLL